MAKYEVLLRLGLSGARAAAPPVSARQAIEKEGSVAVYSVKVVWSDANPDATVSITLLEDGQVFAVYVDCGPQTLRRRLEAAARALKSQVLPELF